MLERVAIDDNNSVFLRYIKEAMLTVI